MASLPPPPGPIWTPLPPPPPFPSRRPRGAAVIAVVVAVLLAISGVVLFSNPDAPRGSFRFLDRTAAGLPVRWNPCEPIHYVANLEDAPVGALEDLQGAARRVSEATGIEFVYDGETEATVEFQTHVRYIVSTMQGGRWLPVLVIWLPHDEFMLLDSQEGVVAFAHPQPGPADLEDQYVSGLIVVDAEAGLPSGFDYRFSDGLVLMHELGHLVGLGHVTDPSELMFTSQRLPGNPISDWGPGDREGLRELGREAGCLSRVRTSSPSTSP
ncbi:MAG TPA: matrixin family metalloprotease [Actinomycetota bacterium]|nr:matrixin family metalloprotease [Actinomycetota bacterium]